MDIGAVSFLDLHPNYLNLTLFICRLFASGSFRTAHILYENVAFDDRFLDVLESKCPFRIPKTITDISEFREISMNQYIDEHQRSDYILQLIFVQFNHKAETLKRISRSLTFYRIFIFSSSQNWKLQAKWTENVWNELSRNSSTSIIFHNKSNGTIRLYRLSKLRMIPLKSVDLQKKVAVDRDVDLFDSMLGVDASGIVYVDQVNCASINASHPQDKAAAKFYFERFKMNYIDAISYDCNESGVFILNHKYVRPQSKSIYSDLTYPTMNVDNPR